MLLAGQASGAEGETPDFTPSQLARMDIEELANIQISSVSKRPEPLGDAAAAVYVITHDEIIRSGATTLPEVLRLAPNLEVAEIQANGNGNAGDTYAISARGFNSGLANKLLVLIDGRSVYSPLQAGVYWNMQIVPLEDIDRIEVISGAGGTLWGANAVNGVINIITRNSQDTTGGLLSVGGGNVERGATVQYGGGAGKDKTYRVYGTGSAHRAFKDTNGTGRNDSSDVSQAGFRFDWHPSRDLLTVQGDAYDGSEKQLVGEDQLIAGANLLTRWTHKLDGGSSLQVQAYYDNARHLVNAGGGGFKIDTLDLDIQHSVSLGSHAIVWGGGARRIIYKLNTLPNILDFTPADGAFNLANAFIEDTISLTDRIKLIPGLKLEDDAYVSLQALPSLRASWKITDANMVWGSISRAVRSPTPLDRDVALFAGGIPFLVGGADFQSEKLMAYELGFRSQPTPNLSFSLSTYYNDYSDLRSITITPNGLGGVFPLAYDNGMDGETYGVEIWGSYGIFDWWRLSAGFNYQHENFDFEAPGIPLNPVQQGAVLSGQQSALQQIGNDPTHQASLKSSMNLPRGFTLDGELRRIGPLHNPSLSGYVEFNMRVGWHVSENAEVSLSGFNLLHAHHQEFATVPPSFSEEVPRSFYAELRLRY